MTLEMKARDVSSTESTMTSCALCHVALPKKDAVYFDTRFGHPDYYAIVTCPTCNTMQTTPRPDAISLQKLYERYYNFGGEKGTFYTQARERFLTSWAYRMWLWLDGDISFHLPRGQGRLLDIGCNEGRGLGLYERNGFDPEGLEWNTTASEVARQRGYVVYTDALQDLHPQEKYDVIVLSNVLEHAIDPAQMLQHIRRLLNPQGQLWLSCPNVESL